MKDSLSLKSKVNLIITIAMLLGMFNVLLIDNIKLVALNLGLITSLLGLAIYLNRFLFRRLNRIERGIQRVATGDLTVELEEDRKDQLGELAKNINWIVREQKELLTKLLSEIKDLSSYSEELSASAEAGNTTIEETDQSIGEMSASIQQISASIQEVSSFAQQTTAQAQLGSENINDTIDSIEGINYLVKDTVESINQLAQNSKAVGKIVELINNIAEQTNLLALNAAIEAARANSSTDGAGFAVVADEIRVLATETAQATENIEQLITETQDKSKAALDSIKKVELKAKEGKAIAEEAEEVFVEIKNYIEETSNQIEQTAISSQHLAENTNQIMDSSQQVTEMSQEVSDSSENLTVMAQKLQDLVEPKISATLKAKFKLAKEILEEEVPGSWSLKEDKLYKGETLINKNYQLVDQIGKVTGAIVTIFAGYMSVATNLRIDNVRADGTSGKDEITTMVLEEGKEYYGRADILGEMHQTAYAPIKSDAGENIGILFMSIPEESSTDIFTS
ncbi:methyl-accepting chemotaxis protein [Natroniella sulfidigena]|uniref:methyl-accepting chemotaxis protein n=1 Tax=Natroniella sulfidigena TaxID=723921 RepID=UPI00200A1135|nr:methyl-accepting chemotaxis protein [Natroniella sulfidigena]MCK8817828.1 methyl-accepting chemotaxis protein [Natroniella sulfidigena]